MMKTIVSLVSDQTIPNVQLIKEFKDQASEFWFFHSPQTAKQAGWIAEAAALDPATVRNVEFDAYDITKIQQTLASLEVGERDFVLNMTGGTKLWIMIFLEYFKNLGADIYYLTGRKKEMVKVFPQKGQRQLNLSCDITLSEYLHAYGFTFKPNRPAFDFAVACAVFDYYTAEAASENSELFRKFREERKNIKNTYSKSPEELGENVVKFIQAVNFPLNDGKLNKQSIRFLSGEWLEEWVYYRLKEELGLDDAHIATGIQINKEGVANEMDVIFVYDHKLYTIECKTSVKEEREMPDGTVRPVTILGEVIYKADSIRQKFGLFASSTILTLSELRDENMKPKNEFKIHFDRAELSRINMVSLRQIKEMQYLRDLIPGLNAH